jgi:hypothetical protein
LKNKIEELNNNNKDNLLIEENIKLKEEIKKLKSIEKENKSLTQKLKDIQNLKNENEKINKGKQNKFNNEILKIESGLNENIIEGIKNDGQLISDRKEINTFEECLIDDFYIDNKKDKNNIDKNNNEIKEKKNQSLISENNSIKNF